MYPPKLSHQYTNYSNTNILYTYSHINIYKITFFFNYTIFLNFIKLLFFFAHIKFHYSTLFKKKKKYQYDNL